MTASWCCHGTDTMAYTAAALSYLVQGSRKPIVLTGSQQPMANPFTDAKLNLYQAVLYACDETSRDVCLVFDGHVIAGTRARKQRTMSFNAFASVNYPDLAVIRNDRIVRPGGMAAPGPTEMRSYETLDERVVVMKLTPSLSPPPSTSFTTPVTRSSSRPSASGGFPSPCENPYSGGLIRDVPWS